MSQLTPSYCHPLGLCPSSHRLILEFLDRQCSSLQSANKCAEWALYCCKCCLWCLEKIVAFINRNAYVVMAIRGTSYCDSAITAVKLIVSVGVWEQVWGEWGKDGRCCKGCVCGHMRRMHGDQR